MAASEILNKTLLKAIAEILNTGGVTRLTSSLNTDEIKLVASLFSPIAAPMFRFVDYSEEDSLAALATGSWTVVSCGENEVARILALEASVGSPTGLAGGGLIKMKGFLSLGETGCDVFHFPQLSSISEADPWEARIAKGGFKEGYFGAIHWEGLVPPGKSFTVQIDSAVNFPANTVGIVRAVYAIGPAPFQPPT